jgi:hypothetical protein
MNWLPSCSRSDGLNQLMSPNARAAAAPAARRAPPAAYRRRSRPASAAVPAPGSSSAPVPAAAPAQALQPDRRRFRPRAAQRAVAAAGTAADRRRFPPPPPRRHRTRRRPRPRAARPCHRADADTVQCGHRARSRLRPRAAIAPVASAVRCRFRVRAGRPLLPRQRQPQNPTRRTAIFWLPRSRGLEAENLGPQRNKIRIGPISLIFFGFAVRLELFSPLVK